MGRWGEAAVPPSLVCLIPQLALSLLRDRGLCQARIIVIEEIDASEFLVHQEVTGYMLILQEKFPQSI